jgi:predicted nucleic acid-binding protein
LSGLIADASVAVKWLVMEDGSDRALALFGQGIVVPAFLRIEVANVLRTMATRGRLSVAQADDALQALLDMPLEIVVEDADLLEAALRIGMALRHPVYDCLYLALARRLNVPLWTADRRLAALGAGAGYEIRFLGNVLS